MIRAFTRHDKPGSADAAAVIKTLNSLYPHKDNFVNRELGQVLLYLNAPGAVSRTVQLVMSATDTHEKILEDKVLERNDRYSAAAKRTEQFRPNVQQFALAFSLRSIKEGWSDADRMLFDYALGFCGKDFAALGQAIPQRTGRELVAYFYERKCRAAVSTGRPAFLDAMPIVLGSQRRGRPRDA